MAGLKKVGPTRKRPRMRMKRARPWREQIFARDNWTCRYCGRKVWGPDKVPQHHRQRATIDHVKPRAFGGPDDPANYVTACFSCNNSKGSNAGIVPPDWQTENPKEHP